MTRSSNKSKEEPSVAEQLKILTDKVEAVYQYQQELKELHLEIKSLREENNRKQEKIESLETRVDFLEQYTRQDDIIITGLKVQSQSYARAASVDQEDRGDAAPEAEKDTVEQQVVDFLESNKMEIDRKSISACHQLGRGREGRPANIILRFANRKAKVHLLRQGKKLQNTGVYLNEHLTRKNIQIAKYARKLRKENKIKDTWVRNCAVFIRKHDDSVRKMSGPEDFNRCGLPPMLPDDGRPRQ